MDFNAYIRALRKVKMSKTTNKPLLTVLLISGVLFLNPFYSSAQEGSPGHGLGDFNHNDGNYNQDQLPAEGMGDAHNNVVSTKENSVVKPTATNTQEKKKVLKPIEPKKVQAAEKTTPSGTAGNTPENAGNAENNESVLGFNVLYYMIQKFKFNDVNVIDQ